MNAEKTPRRIVPAIETLIISTGTACNLDCVYCHNRPFFKSRFPRGAVLSPERFLLVCRDYFAYAKVRGLDRAGFCFSGGEPLLRGIAYYRELFAVQKRALEEARVPGLRPVNLFQTNGLLLDVKWARFLRKNGVRLGLSADGPPSAQDRARLYGGPGSGAAALERKAALLNAEGVEFGFLTVVSEFNSGFPAQTLAWLASMRPQSVAFIPCLDYQGAVGAGAYGDFLLKVFEEWVKLGRYGLRVRNFHFLLLHFLGAENPALPCENAGLCPCTVNVNLDGRVYICDAFMGRRRGLLGGLGRGGLLALEKSRRYRAAVSAVASLPDRCRGCQFLPVCNGGCFYRRRGGGKKPDYLCRANKRLFARVKDYVEKSLSPARALLKTADLMAKGLPPAVGG